MKLILFSCKLVRTFSNAVEQFRYSKQIFLHPTTLHRIHKPSPRSLFPSCPYIESLAWHVNSTEHISTKLVAKMSILVWT